MKKLILLFLTVFLVIFYFTVFSFSDFREPDSNNVNEQLNEEVTAPPTTPIADASKPDLLLESSSSRMDKSVLTAGQIIKKHRPAFEKLQLHANKQVDNMLTSIAEEYNQQKQENQSISPFSLYDNYAPKMYKLEQQIDKDFQLLYQALQTELTANGHSAKEASSIKQTYQENKQKTRKAVIEKIMKKLSQNSGKT